MKLQSPHPPCGLAGLFLLTAALLLPLLLAGCDTATPPPTETPVPLTATLPPATLTPAPTHTPTLKPDLPLRPVTPEEGLRAGKITDLWVDPAGSLWVIGEIGAHRFLNGEWTTIFQTPLQEMLGLDGKSRIWVTLKNGTAVAAYYNDNWMVYGSEQGWIPLPRTDYRSGATDGLTLDLQGNLWWATGFDDLRFFDYSAGRWKSFQSTSIGFKPADPNYQGNFLTDVVFSQNNSVWVSSCSGAGEGFTGQGVVWHKNNAWTGIPATAKQCVMDMEIDRRGRVWVGAFDEVLRYDPAIPRWESFPLPEYERRQLVLSIDLDAAGKPWIKIIRQGSATWEDTARYHLEQGGWVLDFDHLGGNDVLAFAPDGTAYLCDYGTLYRLGGETPQKIGSVGSTTCHLAVDGSGRVWAAGDNQLFWHQP